LGRALFLMARVAGRSGPIRTPLNGLHPNGEPPQSTLAAQLVDKITEEKARLSDHGDETFRQLLREVLSGDNDQSIHGPGIETNINVNYKLIYVIVKAGLDPLIQVNLFSGRDSHFRQAIESLAAIETTIQRNPDVLVTIPSGSGQDPNYGGPLFLWLIPKLLGLISRAQSEFEKSIMQLLRTVLTTQRKTHIKGAKSHLILKYLKGVVAGRLLSITFRLRRITLRSKIFSSFWKPRPPTMLKTRSWPWKHHSLQHC